eukprot:CAMPEP_0170525446 /NCGR_PEP_ID=MMETSP0209-20121228/10932_1 /TAXON_ID=665100 ORGANISM="Litonotus pictus, Strain P1" /NCGR_SAMPLE_ID=MMETSP0209 /ASSEMBLY_ACC=CAM_ASM_000301 /LENGTH=479 /DNA_ID=CAMNT_0010814723 /DNA_START=2477 /DNA_END=3916 /DNA_ORIENTATION=+
MIIIIVVVVLLGISIPVVITTVICCKRKNEKSELKEKDKNKEKDKDKDKDKDRNKDKEKNRVKDNKKSNEATNKTNKDKKTAVIADKPLPHKRNMNSEVEVIELKESNTKNKDKPEVNTTPNNKINDRPNENKHSNISQKEIPKGLKIQKNNPTIENKSSEFCSESDNHSNKAKPPGDSRSLNNSAHLKPGNFEDDQILYVNNVSDKENQSQEDKENAKSSSNSLTHLKTITANQDLNNRNLKADPEIPLQKKDSKTKIILERENTANESSQRLSQKKDELIKDSAVNVDTNTNLNMNTNESIINRPLLNNKLHSQHYKQPDKELKRVSHEEKCSNCLSLNISSSVSCGGFLCKNCIEQIEKGFGRGAYKQCKGCNHFMLTIEDLNSKDALMIKDSAETKEKKARVHDERGCSVRSKSSGIKEDSQRLKDKVLSCEVCNKRKPVCVVPCESYPNHVLDDVCMRKALFEKKCPLCLTSLM